MQHFFYRFDVISTWLRPACSPKENICGLLEMATMGFGLHSRPIPNTPRRIAKCRFKSRIANLFMKLRSIVLEMIIFRLQPFKTLRGVIMHHQNCVVLNNSQVLVREAPPPSENGIEFKVANPLLTRRQLFSLVFSLSQISRISSLGSVMVTAKSTLDLRAERCRPSLGSVVVIPKSTLDLRAERCESCRKWQESNSKKAQQMGGTKNPAKVTE